MLEFAHALTGGVIAYKIGNPALSLPLAFVSHFVLDLLPHWNPHLSAEKKKCGFISKKTFFLVIIDCFIGLILGLSLAFRVLPDIQRTIIIIIGCFFGILPDLVEAPFFFLNQKGRFLSKLVEIQSNVQFNVSFWPGILFQVVYILLLFHLLAI